MILDHYVEKIGVNPNAFGEIVLLGTFSISIWNYSSDNTFIEFKSKQLLPKDNEKRVIDFCWISGSNLFVIALHPNLLKMYNNHELIKEIEIDL